jgi:K+-transporting ATPase ATPase A chain
VVALFFLFFTSAATGIAVSIVFIRGLTGRPLGNFYIDLTLSITRILLPISLVGAVVLMAAGVPETLAAPVGRSGYPPGDRPGARGPFRDH